MLCAAWELYVEEVLVEGARALVGAAIEPSYLPDRVKGKIAQVAKNDPHNHGALKLCGDGWKSLYLEAVKAECSRLNTPKFGQVSELFQTWLDVTPNNLRDYWRHDVEDLNAFVQLRGEIAHRGADAQYVQRDRLRNYMQMIEELVIDTDNYLAHHLKTISHNNRRPWNSIPVRH